VEYKLQSMKGCAYKDIKIQVSRYYEGGGVLKDSF